jgi:CheY-like chemotaxis protein
VLIASGLPGAEALVVTSGARPDVLLVDYHLDDGNGIDAIAALRGKLGDALPAALVTADRSPQVRERARAKDIAVMHKPLKPAALRAFLSQWRVARPAAE